MVLAIVLLAHGLALAWLLEHAPDRTSRPEAPPIVVSLLAPAPAAVAPIARTQNEAPRSEPKAPPGPPKPAIMVAKPRPAKASVPVAKPPQAAPAPARKPAPVPPSVAPPTPPAPELSEPSAAPSAAPSADEKAATARETTAATSAVPLPPPGAPVETAARFDAAYLRNPPPRYPPLARRLGEEGRIILRVRVDVSGAPASVEILEGSGSARLDAAALQTVSRWRFTPAKRGERPIDSWVQVPIVFKLEN